MLNPLLANLATTSDAVRMDLYHPATGVKIESTDGKVAHIMLRSIDSDATDELKRKALAESAKRGTRGKVVTLEQTREKSAEAVAACTQSWLLVDPETKQVIDYPATLENKLELYSSPSCAWIVKQVDAFLSDTGNFMLG